MRMLLKNIFVITLIVFFVSCREPLDDVDINTQQKVLVVEGMITNKKEQYLIRLTQASPYNTSKIDVVDDAIVYVLDNTGGKYFFRNTENGKYYSDTSQFIGELYKTYTLFISTSNGLEYKSTPCTITPNDIKIDTIYGINEKFLLMQGDDNFLDNYIMAFHLFADITYNSNQKTNTRFEVILASPYYFTMVKYITLSNEIIDMRVDENGNSVVDSFLLSYYNYKLSNANLLPTIVANTDYTSGNKLQKIPLTFIYPKIDTVKNFGSSSIYYGYPWVVQVNAFSISDESFDYYYNIIKQLEGENTIFEPLPVQLNGNIACVTDSTIPAFGLFEANAVISKFVGVKLGKTNLGEPRYKLDTATCWPIIKIDTTRFLPFFK